MLTIFNNRQGSSIINYVFEDPQLSREYTIRAITRDVTSNKAKQLASSVEVVQADINDRQSLTTALFGVHTIFAMTTPSFGPHGFSAEYAAAVTIADIAVEQGCSYLIFSTLPSVTNLSEGKLTKVTPFDAKAKAEEYIRGLPIKSAFYCPGSFMENFASQKFLAPKKMDDNSWILIRPNSPGTKYPLIDAVDDGGKFVGAILADPEKFEGKKLCAAEGFYSLEQICKIVSKATGEKVAYKQVSVDEFRKGLVEAFGGEHDLVDIFVEAFAFYEDPGYFGPASEELVHWAKENARGTLTTFEEFLEKQPLKLE
jgi:uncharacterized protein YbjT (DUF2867 family)